MGEFDTPLQRAGGRILRALQGPVRKPTFWLTRHVLLRFLGLIYLVAFVSMSQQILVLIGADGLLPAVVAMERSGLDFIELPSVFWINASDVTLQLGAWLGVALSLALLAGVSNAVLMFVLWALYMSYVHIGQVWYGYGWEILLLEAGFLAIFLCPLREWRPFAASSPPAEPVMWLYRWLLFRVMFGAGLIKLRGDPCWTELTCLAFHYETQPIPNPLSWWLHQAPLWFHKAAVAWNHVVELVVPFCVFGPRRVRHAGGAVQASFQLILIASGNLSFLNWLTLAVCIPCFDDQLLQRLFPRSFVDRLKRRTAAAEATPVQRYGVWALVAVVGALSIMPMANLASPEQEMNSSFDRLHLVNTYGAFGSVGRERFEVIIAGSNAEDPRDPAAEWLEYELPCKPGRVDRAPCLITPYHYRLDWQIWFAAMQRPMDNPWMVHLVYKLLRGDPAVLKLVAANPFPAAPPRWIRAHLYRYRFSAPGEGGPGGENVWWVREPVGPYLPPLHAGEPALLWFLEDRGWLPADVPSPAVPPANSGTK